MRVFPLVLAALLLVPLSAGEFGIEDDDGYPVSADGFEHNPDLRLPPEALQRVQGIAMDDARNRGIVPDAAAGSDYPAINRVGPATIYPYYPILMAEIQRLALDHPDKLRVHVAGKSELGLDLTFLEIYDIDAEGGDGFVPLEEREVVWIDGGTHSNEYSGVYFVLALAQWLLDGSPEDELAQWVLENRHTWILPMVNPDGSHVMGRLNANLVNINRNYPVIWGGQGTDDVLNNPGPAPASEIETKVNIEWMERIVPDYYASVHCCGNLWLYPYGEDGYDPADNQTLATICREALPEVLDDCGPIWSTIYPASGSSVDTAYEFTGAAAFGFEMSGRSNLVGVWGEPVTFEEVAVQERESWGAIMHAFQHVHLYGAYPVPIAIVDRGDLIGIQIENQGYGPLVNATLKVGGHDVAVHDLPANASVIVEVPWPAQGLHDVEIVYEKRIMAAPMAALRVPIAVGEVADAPLDALRVHASVMAADDADASATPLVLVVLGLLVALVRRR